MLEENQQYPTIDCKKVKKAKTTSLKLLDEKDEKTQFEKIPHQDKPSALHQRTSSHANIGFAYLDQSKGLIPHQKSFDEIMNETRKFLQLKKKMNDDQKKRQEKKQRKNKSKRKKQQKAEKKQRKNKKKAERKQIKQEDIILQPLDTQRFQTENVSIKRIIQKIKFLQNLSEKCNIFSPILFKIQEGSKSLQKNQQNSGISQIFSNSQFLAKLQGLQLEIELIKKNTETDTEKKEILTPFEVQEMSKWEIDSKKSNRKSPESICSTLVQKYVDTKNFDIYAEQLQNELEYMESTFFSMI